MPWSPSRAVLMTARIALGLFALACSCGSTVIDTAHTEPILTLAVHIQNIDGVVPAQDIRQFALLRPQSAAPTPTSEQEVELLHPECSTLRSIDGPHWWWVSLQVCRFCQAHSLHTGSCAALHTQCVAHVSSMSSQSDPEAAPQEQSRLVFPPDNPEPSAVPDTGPLLIGNEFERLQEAFQNEVGGGTAEAEQQGQGQGQGEGPGPGEDDCAPVFVPVGAGGASATCPLTATVGGTHLSRVVASMLRDMHAGGAAVRKVAMLHSCRLHGQTYPGGILAEMLETVRDSGLLGGAHGVGNGPGRGILDGGLWVLHYGVLTDEEVGAVTEVNEYLFGGSGSGSGGVRGVHLVHVASSCAQFESPTMKALELLVQAGVPAAVLTRRTQVLYMHTKGASYKHVQPSSVASASAAGPVHDWRRYLLYHTVTRWRTCHHLLASGQFDVLGTNLRMAPASVPDSAVGAALRDAGVAVGKVRYFFMGNFWWTTTGYLRSLCCGALEPGGAVATGPRLYQKQLHNAAAASDMREPAATKYHAELYLLHRNDARAHVLHDSGDVYVGVSSYPPDDYCVCDDTDEDWSWAGDTSAENSPVPCSCKTVSSRSINDPPCISFGTCAL